MTDTKIYAGFCYCWEDCSHIVSSSQSQCICVCYDVNCLNLSAFVVDSVHDPQSRKMQARHYKALQELFKKTKPNKEDIAHLLDLEFEKALKPPMGLDECKHKTNSNMYSTSHL